MIGRVLARHQWAPDLWHWGELSYRGLDWRICEPAAYLDNRPLPATGEVASFLLHKMPAERMVEILEDDNGCQTSTMPARRWAERLMDKYGVEDVSWNQCIAELEPGLQLCVALLRELASAPKVLFIDDASRGLTPQEQTRFWDVVKTASSGMLVLAASRPSPFLLGDAPHGTIAWLANGRLRKPEDLNALRHLAARPVSEASPAPAPPKPPRWFQWILWGRLAGMSRPGLLDELAKDVRTLKAQGVTSIVSLEEEPLHHEALAAAGFATLHFPVVDMAVPSLADALRLGTEILARIDRGESVALHCKAGLGRTGTMLAICLILRGYSAVHVFVFLRQLNPYYIQSDAQHRFVEDFAHSLSRGELHAG